MSHNLTKDELEKIEFINLVTHSHFSIPFGIGKIKDIVKRVNKVGHKGLCLTDINSMAGCLELLKISKDKKLPIILGAELRIIDTLENHDKANKYFNITCLVKNFTGYKNLVRLLSESGKEDHFYYKPRISLEELINHKDGLIILSGNMYGMISQAIIKETNQEELLVQIFKEQFEDDFYMQINYHPKNMEWKSKEQAYVDIGYDPQKLVNIRLMELAKKYDVKCIINQNVFMPEERHKGLQDILLGNSDEFKKSGYKEYHPYFMKSVSEMYEDVKTMASYISDQMFLDMCSNTIDILNKTYDLKMKFKPELPSINYKEHIVNIDPIWDIKFNEVKSLMETVSPSMLELFEIANNDIALKTTLKVIIKLGKIDFSDPVYVNRLADEIKIIQRNGVIQLLDYFLLLEDVTNYVVSIGKYRGFGRGSGAGSLLSYTLDITDCDPLIYNLLFERFLTKERIGKFLIDHPDYPIDKLDPLDF